MQRALPAACQTDEAAKGKSSPEVLYTCMLPSPLYSPVPGCGTDPVAIGSSLSEILPGCTRPTAPMSASRHEVRLVI